ncbi:MAG: hypothetical protein JEZ01_18335 [Labilibaculum sp.]|nr:hypothetical protein [Labilibaculum sp.]MBI9059729.1 hypothetical protein [Labilibaculum sp.]
MNELVKERIAIAEKFKTIHKLKFKSPERRDAMLGQTAFLEYPAVNLLLMVCVFASITALFFTAKWDNAGLLVIVSLAMAIRSPYARIEVKLKKHIEILQRFDGDFNPELNVELAKLIHHLNKRTGLIVIGILAFLISIGVGWQVFDVNPYWNDFQIPVLVFSVFLLMRINYISIKFKKNLNSIK